jgi:hypothetical protein
MTSFARAGIVVVLVTLTGCAPHIETALKESVPAAPAISGLDGDGKPMQLDEFRGKVVLLDFWRSG